MTVKRMKLSVFTAIGVAMLATLAMAGSSFAGEFSRAWHGKNTSIVLDAYEYTPIDWSKIKGNTRLAGFINKASDGLSPKYNCGRDALCRVKWRRYAAAKELYHTRKTLAKTLGLKWGAYHLARPGNPIQQANHFLSFAKPKKDDLVALDIENNNPKRWMSLRDAEIFAAHIKRRIGRYPVLYTNHSTAKFIAANRTKYKLLSRLNLWYARYKPSMRGAFPMGNWDSYTLWQFSSMVNCSRRSCPWRVKGTDPWVDVNVVNMSPSKLRKQWPFAQLRANAKPVEEKAPENHVVLASAKGTDNSATGAVSSSKTVSPKVQLVSLTRESGTATMAISGSIATPSWRPGAVIVRRIEHRTSDQVIASILTSIGKTFTARVLLVRTLDEIVSEVQNARLENLNDDVEPMFTASHVFPVEAVVFNTFQLGPLSHDGNQI